MKGAAGIAAAAQGGLVSHDGHGGEDGQAGHCCGLAPNISGKPPRTRLPTPNICLLFHGLSDS